MKTFESMNEFCAYASVIAKRYKFFISKYNEDYSVDINGFVNLFNKDLTEFPIRFNNIVGGSFDCSRNKLTSLEGAPKYIEGDFWCNENQLISLLDAPKYIGGNFYCHHYIDDFKDSKNNYNPLVSLKGAPEVIKGHWFILDKYNSYPEYLKYLLVKKIEAL